MTQLERRLGPIDAAAIGVSNVIGGGIFFVPILVAGLVPDARLMLLVWLGGGVLAFFGAMAYAELAALRPRSGGEYVYLTEAYGPLAGFFTGWTSFVAGFSGAMAASSLALAMYLGRFVPWAGDATALIAIPIPLVPLVISRRALVALAVLALLTAIHARGLGPGRRVQDALAAAKILALVVFAAAGFAFGTGSAARLVAATGTVTASGSVGAFIPVMFTYSGWNAASYVAEEVRTPGRNVPLALGLGTLVVIALYLALNALNVFAMPVAALASAPGDRLVDAVAERLFGFATANLVAAFTIVSIAASVSAMVLAGPRVYFAMARDGVFPRGAARVHPRFRVPVAAIVAQSVWSGVLVLSGSLAQLVSYTGFTLVLFNLLAVAAVFVLRRRIPDAERPFRAWGYPWAPALFVAAAAVMLVNELWRSRGTALAGLAVIAAGLPLFWLTRRRAPQTGGDR